MSQDESDAPLGQFDAGEDVYVAFDKDRLISIHRTPEGAEAALKGYGATHPHVSVMGLHR